MNSIKTILSKALGWMKDSNRPKHMAVGFALGFFYGCAAAFWAGVAAEYKDWAWAGKKGGKWGWMQSGNGFDYLDLIATTIAGIAGQFLGYLFIF